MKNRILSFVIAFFIMIMGIMKYPVFSYAYTISGYIISGQVQAVGNTFYTSNTYNLTSQGYLEEQTITSFNSASPCYVVAFNGGTLNTNRDQTYKIAVYWVGDSSRTKSGFFYGSRTYNASYNSNYVIDGNIYYNFTNTLGGYNYAVYDYGSIPYVNTSSAEVAIRYMLDNGQDFEDLGFIQGVGYHVDSYGMENNPVGTNELITWDSESTTGIDLTQSNYSVEFAIRDNSYQYRRTYSDMMVQDSTTTQDLFQNPINTGFAYAMDFVTFLSSYVYPSGSNQRNLAQGRAVKAPSNGKSIGLGTFPARNMKASFNAFSKYSLYANSSGDTDFKNYLDRVIDSATRYDYYENAKNFYNDTAPNYFSYGISYDIMARIVDTSNGNKGDWLIINKHNTPYIQSDSENRLAGAVTVLPSIINNFDPQVDVVVDVPDIEIDNNIDFRPMIKVGYVEAQPNVTIEEGDVITINNNYEYTYEGDSIVNDIENITNIYGDLDVDGDGDGDGDVSDPDNPLGGIKQGLIIAKKFIKSLTSWFRKIFNPFLPIWAQNVVIIAIPITLFGIVWKMVKPLLSLLGKEILPLLIEFFTGIPRLPG